MAFSNRSIDSTKVCDDWNRLSDELELEAKKTL